MKNTSSIPSPEEFNKMISDFENSLYTRQSSSMESSTPVKQQSAYEELMSMVGLENVKTRVLQELRYHQVMKFREANGYKVPERLLHLLFTGAPGCGKTTVARIIAQIYRELGILKSGQLIEVNRGDLIGEFIGQTEKNVNEKIAAARGGVLFIDEIYALTNGDNSTTTRDFGRRAIDTLLPALSDPKSDVMVIGAGYPAEMGQFITANPGLSSRFPVVINFENYTTAQLIQIASNYVDKYKFRFSSEAFNRFSALVASVSRINNFGNARFIITLLENHIIPRLCERVSCRWDCITLEKTSLVEAEDIPRLEDVQSANSRERIGFAS